MRRFLLLLLSLMTTGSQTSPEVKGCLVGWVDFTCPYPNINVGYQKINVINKTKTVIKSSKKDEWEIKDRVSMYHDTKNKKLRVIIKDLQDKDAGKWKCTIGRTELGSVDIKLNGKADKDVCREPFDQTVYKTDHTTITCEYPAADYWSKAIFFCKDRISECEDITEQSNDTDTILNMSIRNVSPQRHNGIYWCGLTSGDGSYRAGLRQTRLKVEDITNFQRSPKVGDTFEYFCRYSEEEEEESVKFICKGEDPSICQPLISTTRENIRFSMTVDQQKRNITITLLKVKQEDSGTYWCGGLSTDGTHRFFHRMVLTAVTSPSTPPPTESPERADVSVHVIAVIICAVVLLLFVLILIVIYKRLYLSKRTRHGAAAQNTEEDYVYEEIQERITNPDSRHATKTVYATVDFPKNSSASLHYSAISFQRSSGNAGGEGLTLKPSSSACEYSSVNQSPSAANQASRPSEEPLYSTVNKNQ
ncbi:uncharacterized protein LOC132977167 [Labrus mixtus]|uniref:uncharacterized protein LOC132977167 n=1 Tax=Labrus mixtus TaxID=508554 RepID=UPI0029C09BC0|nr:uncharacterized protein LOC132977167 [Labrus mixtus]